MNDINFLNEIINRYNTIEFERYSIKDNKIYSNIRCEPLGIYMGFLKGPYVNMWSGKAAKREYLLPKYREGLN
mgnify:FL=1